MVIVRAKHCVNKLWRQAFNLIMQFKFCVAFCGVLGYNKPIAPVAQLDRVLPSEGKGREFESRQARQFRFSMIL